MVVNRHFTMVTGQMGAYYTQGNAEQDYDWLMNQASAVLGRHEIAFGRGF